MRLDLAVPVAVESVLAGARPGIVRGLDACSMVVELADPPPIGSVISVHFAGDAGGLVVRAEVRRAYVVNAAGVALRAVGLEVLGAPIDGRELMPWS